MSRPTPMNRSIKTAKISLRVLLDDEIAIGPGKADLLEGIEETGSIAAAGRRMKMSYKRAWTLVETMNACFRGPLVETSKGGAARGGAALTPLGEDVLSRYRSMESAAKSAVQKEMAKLKSMLAD